MDKLTISNMELYYGDFKALKGINLNIQANEITAFIGPSGCGKSTLLKSLNRMNDLVEGCRITGSILLDGEDIFCQCRNRKFFIGCFKLIFTMFYIRATLFFSSLPRIKHRQEIIPLNWKS